MDNLTRLKTKNKPFWILTLSVVFALTLPILIQDGMFQDAVLYSSVSHNMAIGFGNFWFPQYSTLNLEGIPSFHEQPPLVFGILSTFYRVFGDSIYVERTFVLITLLINMFLIQYLWKLIFKDKPTYASMGWLPIFLWIIIPICFWSYRNNMIENTMSIFTLISIILSYKALERQKTFDIYWLISGIFIFLASFSKGLPGLFPLVFPVIYWFATRKISFAKACQYSFVLFAVPLLIYAVLLQFPDSQKSLSIYFYDRLIRRVNTMPTTAHRYDIIWRLFTELIPIYIIAAIAYFSGRKDAEKVDTPLFNRTAVMFLLVGISGSLPLAFTMVQKGWYMVAALPFFAIAFAIFIAPYVGHFIEKLNTESTKFIYLSYFSMTLLVAVLGFTIAQKGKISREIDVIQDVYKIGNVVPRFSTLTVPLPFYDQYDFVLQGFLVRYFNISLDPNQEYQYFLNEKSLPHTVPPGYRMLDIDLVKYNLYEKQIQKDPQNK